MINKISNKMASEDSVLAQNITNCDVLITYL